MNQRHKSFITIILFTTIIFGLLLFCVIHPDRQFSETENRKLQEAPGFSVEGIASGSFMKEFEAYASDQMAGRDLWVETKSRVDVLAGRKDNGRVYFGENDYLFPIERLNMEQLEKNLGFIQAFIEKQQDMQPDLNVSILAVPTSTQVMGEYLPSYAPVQDEQAVIGKAREILGKDRVMDVLPVLTEKRHEGVYYKTDHHWTTLGAYYAYCQWAQMYGLEPAELGQFQRRVVSDAFYGTNQSKAGIHGEPDNIQAFDPIAEELQIPFTMTVDTGKEKKVYENSFYEPSYLEGKDKYSYFLSGNNPITLIERAPEAPKTGRSLLLLKDSYAHCFVPFLLTHFDRIQVVDLRYFRKPVSQILEENPTTDLLFLYNAVQLSNDRNFIYLK